MTDPDPGAVVVRYRIAVRAVLLERLGTIPERLLEILLPVRVSL
jgi:hypothetical protein